MHPRPDAIVFDVGGTLLETLENPLHGALRSIEALGVVDANRFATTLEEVVASWRAAGGTPETEDLAVTWEAHYRHSLERVGFSGDAAEAARRMEDGFLMGGCRVFPDVAATLESLGALGLPLGIVSNWPPTLAVTLERAGIAHHFEVIVASGDVGYAKPHRRIFEIAAERLNVALARILYVGDSPHHDVAGATGAGMRALLVDRNGRWNDHPDRLASLTELLDRIQAVPADGLHPGA